MEVKIRPLEENDANTSVKWRNDPEIWSHTAFSATKNVSVDDELKWIRTVIADASCRRFAILADDKYIGNIYLTNIAAGEAEYSIFIGEKSYWGKGVARKASEQIIDYARKTLKLKSVKLGVSEDNLAAVRLYKSLNFKEFSRDNRFNWMRLDLKDWRDHEEK